MISRKRLIPLVLETALITAFEKAYVPPQAQLNIVASPGGTSRLTTHRFSAREAANKSAARSMYSGGATGRSLSLRCAEKAHLNHFPFLFHFLLGSHLCNFDLCDLPEQSMCSFPYIFGSHDLLLPHLVSCFLQVIPTTIPRCSREPCSSHSFLKALANQHSIT